MLALPPARASTAASCWWPPTSPTPARVAELIQDGLAAQPAQVAEPVTVIDRPWQLFLRNGAEIRRDFALLTAGRTSQPVDDAHTIVYGGRKYLYRTRREDSRRHSQRRRRPHLPGQKRRGAGRSHPRRARWPCARARVHKRRRQAARRQHHRPVLQGGRRSRQQHPAGRTATRATTATSATRSSASGATWGPTPTRATSRTTTPR
ncbi:MAG: putative sugar nucleotidyl transferase [Hymenobacter sp.]